MKPLILSFFAVILGYSLFVDKKEEKEPTPASINTRSTNMNSVDITQNTDTVIFYADRYMYDFKWNEQ